MTKPEFKNKPNEHFVIHYESHEGTIRREWWISRSAATESFIFAKDNKSNYHILTTKRTMTMMDEPGKMCVPCGYIDWDEDGRESLIREIYEETSFFLPEYRRYIRFSNGYQPFFVETNPKSNKRQNILLLYIFVLDFSKCPDKFPKQIEEFKSSETEYVKWMSLEEYEKSDIDWAFSQDIRINKAITHIANTL